MAEFNFKGSPIHTEGDLPKVGSIAPDFVLTKTDLTDISLKDFKGKKVILNIFHSLDTGTCAASVRKFNEKVAKLPGTVVLCISKDLPFAHKRFCEAEGIENVISASQFRDTSFTDAYKVTYTDGIIKGLMSRAVVVIDENGKVIYTEQVQESSEEPNYDAVLASLN